jgi:hypothetical protein
MTTTEDNVSVMEDRAIENTRDRLLSGTYFDIHAASHQSVRGYQPPCARGEWAYAMRIIGEMADESDELAQLASKIYGKVNLYAGSFEAAAQIYRAAATALREGYFDVIRNASPEPGRRSDNQRDFNLWTRVQLAYSLKEATSLLTRDCGGVGWALDGLRERENIVIWRHA